LKKQKIVNGIIFTLFVLEKNQVWKNAKKFAQYNYMYNFICNYIWAIFLHFSKLNFFWNKYFENFFFNYFWYSLIIIIIFSTLKILQIEEGCMNIYEHISYIIIYVYECLYMFMYVYTYFYIFLHEKFFTRMVFPKFIKL